MRALFGIVAVALAAALAWIWSEERNAPRGVAPQPAADAAETRLPAALVAGQRPPEGPVPHVSETPLAELEPRAEARVAASDPVPEAALPPPPVHVFGHVSDELGSRVPGVRVELLRGLPASRPVHSRAKFGRVQHTLAETRTDRVGAFDLGPFERSILDEAVLIFGHERYLGTPPHQAVVQDDVEQLLRFPERPASGLELTLVALAGGVEPYAEWSALDLVAQAPDVTRAARAPHPRDVIAEPGRLTVRGLAPGTWSVWLRCQGFAPRRLEVRVTEGPELTRRELTFEGRPTSADHLTPHRPTFEDGASRRDPTLGFDALHVEGQSERRFGERANDRWFAHTLEGFGQGPVRAAYLELELEAQSGMAHNDSLHLEFRGQDARPRWAWGSSIPELPGAGHWRPARRQRFVLDLSNLRKGDETVNLLPELEDGKLDVFVSDDTNVLDLALHVSR